MQSLLDGIVAARIDSECRDRNAVERFQRATYFALEILDGLGFTQTSAAVRRRGVDLGLIPQRAPEVTEAPASVSPIAAPCPASSSVEPDPLTGRRKRRQPVSEVASAVQRHADSVRGRAGKAGD